MIIRIILSIIALGFYSSIVMAVENNNIDNKPEPVKKDVQKSKKVKTLTQSELVSLADLSREATDTEELPINRSGKSSEKAARDTTSDHLNHRDITSANTRSGKNVSSTSSYAPHPYGGAVDRQRMIDSARGPNSMHYSIRQHESTNYGRSVSKK